MVVNELTDPNFILLGENGARRRNEEWFWYGNALIRSPRAAAQSAIVVVGSQASLVREQLDSSAGWIILVPRNYFIDSAVSPEPTPEKVQEFHGLLRRLGVKDSFVVFVFMENSWMSGALLTREISSARSVYCKNTPWNLAHEKKTLNNSYYRFIQNYRNNPERWGLDAVVCAFPEGKYLSSFGYIDSFIYSKGVQVDDSPGSENFWSICASLTAIALSNGSIHAYMRQCVAGPELLPYSGFIENISFNPNLTHMSGNQISVNKNSLHIFGFNLIQSKPARGWGSYTHKLQIFNTGTSEVLEYRLGALRREILDKLQFPSNGATNSYGAYGLPKNQGIDLSGFKKGTYRISVFDHTGYDAVSAGDNILYIGDDNSMEVRLFEGRDGVFLEIS